MPSSQPGGTFPLLLPALALASGRLRCALLEAAITRERVLPASFPAQLNLRIHLWVRICSGGRRRASADELRGSGRRSGCSCKPHPRSLAKGDDDLENACSSGMSLWRAHCGDRTYTALHLHRRSVCDTLEYTTGSTKCHTSWPLCNG
jgi:hypothetical protein